MGNSSSLLLSSYNFLLRESCYAIIVRSIVRIQDSAHTSIVGIQDSAHTSIVRI